VVCGIVELFPRDRPSPILRRYPFDEGALIGVQAGISRQYLPYIDIDTYGSPPFAISFNHCLVENEANILYGLFRLHLVYNKPGICSILSRQKIFFVCSRVNPIFGEDPYSLTPLGPRGYR